MSDRTLHRRRKHFCPCLQAFSTAETFESHVDDCFKINGKQIIAMTLKGEFDSKIMKGK